MMFVDSIVPVYSFSVVFVDSRIKMKVHNNKNIISNWLDDPYCFTYKFMYV